jgi:uracil-DNA glycosylase
MARSDYPTARPFLPEDKSLENLAMAARGCQGCPLFQGAKQVVFGSGSSQARIMLVGEQPGVKEDRDGEPFVGPAGRILDRALAECGLERDELYITNAVKHFKSDGSDGRKRGVKPAVAEIKACRPWMESEIEQVQPEIVIALGAVAARSLTGTPLAIGEVLGSWLQTSEGRTLIVTYHPSAVLRTPGEADQDRIFEALVNDLDRAREAVLSAGDEPRPRA